MKGLVLNADDFGLSPGINKAIIEGLSAKALDRASIMVTTEYFKDAIDFAAENPEYSYGLHFDLTLGRPQSGTYPCKGDINFNNGFFGLWFNIFRSNKKNIAQLVEAELRAQLDVLLSRGVQVDHINGHDHVHMIPTINKIVVKVSREFGIIDVRDVNECILKTAKASGLLPLLSPRRLSKYIFFKLLSNWNGNSSRRYFYSILFSCELSSDLVSTEALSSDKFDAYEIMLHPGNPDIDRNLYANNSRMNAYLRSSKRIEEYRTMMNLKTSFIRV